MEDNKDFQEIYNSLKVENDKVKKMQAYKLYYKKFPD